MIYTRVVQRQLNCEGSHILLQKTPVFISRWETSVFRLKYLQSNFRGYSAKQINKNYIFTEI
jgi:hypothetical protein